MQRIVPRNARRSDGDGYFPMNDVFLRLLCVAINDADFPDSILVFFGSLQSHEDLRTIDSQIIDHLLCLGRYLLI